MMNTQESAYYIVADRVFGKTDSNSYVNWAVEMISNGLESENLIILAGLDNSDTEEREKYLRASLKDLKIEYPENNEELITFYSHQLANKVILGQVPPRIGLEKIVELIYASDYASRFNSFGDLDEDIGYFQSTGDTIFNTGITKDNIDEFIINEFRLFLEFEKIDDKGILEKAKCKKCGAVMKPVIKTKWRMKRPFKTGYYCCSECSSTELIFVRTQEGKRMIINEMTR